MWNKQIHDGERPPYSYMCFTSTDYLRFAGYLQDVLRYIKQQGAIINYYKNQSTPSVAHAK